MKNEVRRLLFSHCSSCVYPKNSSQPIKEDELLKVRLRKLMNGTHWLRLAELNYVGH